MRIAIMGAAASAVSTAHAWRRPGHDVVFVTRGEHLRAIRANGLRLVGAGGDAVIADARATEDPSQIAPLDVVLFCVKLFDTEDAARAIEPLLAKGGVCITLQNGSDARERIADVQ